MTSRYYNMYLYIQTIYIQDKVGITTINSCLNKINPFTKTTILYKAPTWVVNLIYYSPDQLTPTHTSLFFGSRTQTCQLPLGLGGWHCACHKLVTSRNGGKGWRGYRQGSEPWIMALDRLLAEYLTPRRVCTSGLKRHLKESDPLTKAGSSGG